MWIVGSGLATAVGGLFLFLSGRPSDRALDVMSGFTAGVMLAAANFSLLVPALDRGPLGAVAGGLLVGGLVFSVLDRVIPHIHMRFSERGHDAIPGPRGLLTLSALTVHNVPEGMAVGLAFATGGPELGIPLALAIGIQNVPEGYAAAAPLAKGRSGFAAGIAALTGMVEPPAAFLAFFSAHAVSALIVPALAFAAGAMLYVIVDELIPETEARGNERPATLALLVGFTLMLVLDNAFG
jgi:ZIP family zinc transporter